MSRSGIRLSENNHLLKFMYPTTLFVVLSYIANTLTPCADVSTCTRIWWKSAPTNTLPVAIREDAFLFISEFVITLVSSIYAVPLLWIPRVCVLSGDRRAVLYVDLIIASAKLL